jgi:hypothetical protein
MKLSSLFAAVMLTALAATTGCAADASGPDEEQVVDNDLTQSVRQAQLNGLRTRVNKDFANVTRAGNKLVFRVTKIRSNESLVFVQAHIIKRNASGKDVELTNADLQGSVYAEEVREGLFDGPEVTAVLKKSGSTWSVAKKTANDEAYVVGPTDLAYGEWDSFYGVPRSWMF